MPLKLYKRPSSSTIHIRGTIRGQSIYESTGTSDVKAAEEYRAKREAEIWRESIYGKRAVVTFPHAVTAYLQAAPRSAKTKFYLCRLLPHFASIRLVDISQTQVDQAYEAILKNGSDSNPATKLRGVLTPLRAVLEFASRRQWCDRPAFERPIARVPRASYLRPDQLEKLIEAAADHLKPLIIFLAGTGARMSEALDMEWKHVDLKGRKAVVWQKQGNERQITLPPVVLQALAVIPHREGHVFRPVRSRRSSDGESGKQIGDRYHDNGRTSGGQIKSGWARACRDAGLPGRWREWVPRGSEAIKRTWVSDITPHDLRHTWATWHYCLHQDLIALRDDGGWNTIAMVARYAKRMPREYQDDISSWLNGDAAKRA